MLEIERPERKLIDRPERKLPRFANPSDEVERLINELIVAVHKAGLGQFRIHFYEGGLVDVNLNKKPALRRRKIG